MPAKKPNYIMWNGVDMELYIQTHRPECIATVIQFLRIFQWDRNALAALEHLVKKHNLGTKIKARRGFKPQKKYLMESMTLTSTGVCPRCGGMLRVFTLSKCEQKKSGRLEYKECDDCKFYSEVFRDGGGYETKEIEGD